MNLVKRAEKTARENLDELNFEHSRLVRKTALRLAKKENAAKDIVEVAAWLHDIAKPKYPGMDHHIKGAEMAREILQKLGADQQLTEAVLHCIESHMMKSDVADATMPNTVEAKVVFDADMINLISPFGIAKVIFASTKNGKSFNECIELAKKKTENAFKELQTDSGKKLAEKYWKYNQKFFKLLG